MMIEDGPHDNPPPRIDNPPMDWKQERGIDDAPIHFTFEEASAWADGYNAAVRTLIERTS
jgi:hypothetical protein